MADRELLLVGEDAPGALLRSLRPGLATCASTTTMNPLHGSADHIGRPGLGPFVKRRVAARHGDARLIETVRQLRPSHVLLIKGRGISAEAIATLRSLGVHVSCYHPDNPAWRGGDPGARERLVACDVAVVFSRRQATVLARDARRVEVLPFGYDPDWFPAAEPGGQRRGIAFLGTWSPRRERFLAALEGLDLTIAGTGWTTSSLGGSEPLVEHDAGAVLRGAAIGVNLLHPQCAGSHNMRTREIAASGAAQVCEPGEDGTPLRHGESCLWFETPGELRDEVERLLADPVLGEEMAGKALDLISDDTYARRGQELATLIGLG